jgi:transketolase
MAVAADPGVNLDALREKAKEIRRLSIKSTTAAGSGHPSSSMSAADLVAALYFSGIMRYDAQRPDWPERDRFIMSKGHGCPAQYAAMAMAGYFPVEELMTLRKFGSRLEGHPNMRRLPGIEASTGSLGQGLSIAAGMALAGKIDGKQYRVFCMLGDGETNEGQVWEAAAAAHKFGLDNLIAIVDQNGYQQTGATRDVLPMSPLGGKFAAFGWEAIEIDGHHMGEVVDGLQRATQTRERPTAIIARTHKGHGVSFVQSDYTFHGKALSEEQMEKALEELR